MPELFPLQPPLRDSIYKGFTGDHFLKKLFKYLTQCMDSLWGHAM
jgi:hypothetical protein